MPAHPESGGQYVGPIVSLEQGHTVVVEFEGDTAFDRLTKRVAFERIFHDLSGRELLMNILPSERPDILRCQFVMKEIEEERTCCRWSFRRLLSRK